MFKKIKFNILGLTLLIIIGVAGCKKDNKVTDPISPDGYPKVTFTLENDVTEIREGESLTYTI